MCYRCDMSSCNCKNLDLVTHEEMIAKFEKDSPGFKEAYEKEAKRLEKKRKTCINCDHGQGKIITHTGKYTKPKTECVCSCHLVVYTN